MTREEAIRRIKAWNLDSDDREVLAVVIPELKESEDERMLREIKRYIKEQGDKPTGLPNGTVAVSDMIAWLEKQGVCDIDYPQKYQDNSQLNGCIVLEDFNGGEGFYKLNLDYLNKKQVEEVEEMVRTWNKELKASDENIIKACIGMCLTDANEQRFKDYGTNLKDCLAWLEKQGNQPKFKPGDWIVFNGLTLQVKEIVKGFYRTISKGGITNSYDWNIDNVARLCTIREIPNLDDND